MDGHLLAIVPANVNREINTPVKSGSTKPIDIVNIIGVVIEVVGVLKAGLNPEISVK